jgi:hypothetical protein
MFFKLVGQISKLDWILKASLIFIYIYIYIYDDGDDDYNDQDIRRSRYADLWGPYNPLDTSEPLHLQYQGSVCYSDVVVFIKKYIFLF